MLYIIGRESTTDTIVVMEQYQETDFVTPPAVLPDMKKLAEFWGPRGEEFARLVFNAVGIKTEWVGSMDAAQIVPGATTLGNSEAPCDECNSGTREEVPPTLAGWPPPAESTESAE